MKKNLKNKRAAILIVLILFVVSCTQHHTDLETYTCPMHPTITMGHPGACPICGMNLVRKARPGDELNFTADIAKVVKSPNQFVISSIKTVKGEFRSDSTTIAATGMLVYDTRNLSAISARVSGRLENVLLTTEFQPVKKGQKIAEIYSPELVTAQKELILLQNSNSNDPLINSAREKLMRLGLTDSQITQLMETKHASTSVPVISQYTGYIVDPEINPDTPGYTRPTSGTSQMREMNAIAEDPRPDSQTNLVRQSSLPRRGDFVSAGQPLFNVVTTDALRIELNVPAAQANAINVGDQLAVTYTSGFTENSEVISKEPLARDNQNFVVLRLSTKISGLHAGHLVSAKIKIMSSQSVWIPKEAVIDLGTRRVVFVKEKDIFKPRVVSVGISTDVVVEIVAGIATSEEVASNAQYLVDSESFIQTGNDVQ